MADDEKDLSSEEDLSEDEYEEQDLSDSDVVTKYRMAADVVEVALQGVITQLKPGASLVEACEFGDKVIEGQTAGLFKNDKEMEKGLAFPTCLSVNECVCHFSPLTSESGDPLKAGDVVKIDMGCHIDGFIAVAAHTHIVEEEEAPITGKLADVLMATWNASQVAFAMMKPGTKNDEITEAISKVSEAYGVNCVQGTLMHQMKRYIIDGNKVIITRKDPEQKVEESEIEVNEVYALDVAMSTGDGKPKEMESRTTVFKRAVDKSYRLKMKASRYVLTEVNKRFPTLPFTIRALGDEVQGRMGVVECMKHDMLHAYPPIYEKEGDIVVHVKFTVLVMQSGQVKVTLNKVGLPLDRIQSEVTLPEEITAILETVPKPKEKKKGKKKKKKKKAGDGAAAE